MSHFARRFPHTNILPQSFSIFLDEFLRLELIRIIHNDPPGKQTRCAIAPFASAFKNEFLLEETGLAVRLSFDLLKRHAAEVSRYWNSTMSRSRRRIDP
jgi:hypothetical protein